MEKQRDGKAWLTDDPLEVDRHRRRKKKMYDWVYVLQFTPCCVHDLSLYCCHLILAMFSSAL